MVDSFLWEESYLIEGLVYELFFAPVDVPVIIFSLLITSRRESLLNAVGEEGFEFNIRTG